MRHHVVAFAVALSTCFSAACSSGPTASVKLTLRNGSNASSLSGASLGGIGLRDVGAPPPSTPASTSHFAMRLVKVYLVEDVDAQNQNNVGAVGIVWESPHCAAPGNCDYFEFARPTAAVNADLNSQSLPVSAGTYRYVRIEFCEGGPAGPNVRWQADGMASPHEFTLGECGVTSTKFDPPLVLGSGDSVSVALGYDLSTASIVGNVTPDSPATMPALTAPDGHGVGHLDCAANVDPTKKTCFDPPIFSPSAAKGG